MTERYALSRNAATTLAALDQRMTLLGYDPNRLTLETNSPAGVGNRVAAAVSAYFLNDGAFQAQAYKDLPVSQGGYVAANPPLITGASGTLAVDINRWQPLVIINATSQNNIPVDLIQKFLGAQWLGVRPFSLSRSEPSVAWFDPGPPPYLGGVGDAEFRAEMVDVIRRSSQLTTDDGGTLDVSPGAFGNNTLGANDGHGHALNPSTGLSYPANLVKRGDFARCLADSGPMVLTPKRHLDIGTPSPTRSVTIPPLKSASKALALSWTGWNGMSKCTSH